jgi:hypothetical protein
MGKRKPLDDTPVVTGAEERRSLFGWCITGHHEICIVEFPGHRCGCQCHIVEETENVSS